MCGDRTFEIRCKKCDRQVEISEAIYWTIFFDETKKGLRAACPACGSGDFEVKDGI